MRVRAIDKTYVLSMVRAHNIVINFLLIFKAKYCESRISSILQTVKKNSIDSTIDSYVQNELFIEYKIVKQSNVNAPCSGTPMREL